MPLSFVRTSESAYEAIAHETQQLLSAITPNITLDSDEITEWNADILNETDTEMESDNEESDMEIETASVSYNETINSVNTLIKWCEENKKQATKHMLSPVALRSDIVTKHFSQPMVQKKVTDYFKTTN